MMLFTRLISAYFSRQVDAGVALYVKSVPSLKGIRGVENFASFSASVVVQPAKVINAALNKKLRLNMIILMADDRCDCLVRYLQSRVK